MFKNYFDNAQFNLQANRFLNYFADNSHAQAVIDASVAKINDTESWFTVWNAAGDTESNAGNDDFASALYQTAMFYLAEKDPNARKTYNKFIDSFYKGFHQFDFTRYEVPYENSFLPAIKINQHSDKTIVWFGGYDGFMEELIRQAQGVMSMGYNVIIFEGPGQGTALKNGLKFINNFEKPVGAVLDFFNLKDVTLLGTSWGGYFVLRAAAFDKRVARTISYDFFYNGADFFLMGLPKKIKKELAAALENNDESTFNSTARQLMKDDVNVYFKFQKGMDNTGESTPFAAAKNLARHDALHVAPLVNQDVLLLAGAEDQYISATHLPEVVDSLVNAATVTATLFTAETGGVQHCQADNPIVAINSMKDFMSKFEK